MDYSTQDTLYHVVHAQQGLLRFVLVSPLHHVLEHNRGGERGRLHLAKLLQVGGNMLLLDEPTNDLDVETLRALENALLEFPGCAMVISHDRWFLDRIATHIIDYQDEGKVEFFEGNFTEYEEYKKRTLGNEAIQPRRMKYKRITK